MFKHNVLKKNFIDIYNRHSRFYGNGIEDC